MPSKKRKLNSFNRLKKAVKSFSEFAGRSFEQLLKTAVRIDHRKLAEDISKARKNHHDRLKKLEEDIKIVQTDLEEELNKRTQALQSKVDRFRTLQEAAEANNFLLERKRKDLLIQSDELESANEQITQKNEELLRQKEEITEQVEELNRTRKEILERKNELEEKISALLDQADYLHEANQVITNMHVELAKQKDEIVSKNEELTNLNQEKNNLIGIVAHDLKSPLNQIKGLLSIVKMTTPHMDSEAVNCLNLIEESATRLSSMITKILDIEAIEAQTLNLNIRPVHFDQTLKVVVERFKLDAYNKQITLHFSSSSSALINADPGYLNQILENLLSNAIKFSPSGKNIFIDLVERDTVLIGSIRDEGPGLTEEDKKKLFNKYQKLSAKPTGNESSTGLGLSIVKKFVESMSGKIWCESEYGKGATFFVQFPKV